MAFGKRAVVLRRRPGAHVLRIGCGEGFGGGGERLRPVSPPVPGSVSGAGGGGGRLQSWFLLAGPGAGPYYRARFACVRARARQRAFRAGAVRTPDCAREAEGAPLPSGFSGGFQKVALLGRATPGKRLRIPLLPPPSYTIFSDVKII